ncbi:hypothetical protein SDC9_34883 [bioreactor metagenome]|uniref:Uncharacterized protein n=1 Tax=bioreactor metagenome TaxID=1076179 RepID=A0A644VBY2_9ZZZZ|nr:alpha/beta hydrolase family protein [Paludibacter sp.]
MKRSSTIILFLITCFLIQAAQVDTISVYAEKMKKEIKTVVIKPENYSKKKQYPVVYLLHGYSGDYANWVNRVPAVKELATQYGILIVCPDGGYSSWYLDSPVDPGFQYESFITKDLISFIDKQYATIPNRNGRAITGLSMGGHGGLYLAIRNRTLFAHAGSMSGAVDVLGTSKKYDLTKRIGKSYEEAPELWRSHSVAYLVESLNNKDLNIIIDCGVADFLYEMNAALHQKLIKLRIDHDYIERPGKHNWEYWANAIHYQVLFFSRCFTKGESN